MAQTFASSKRVIELQDSSQGLIVGNGAVSIFYMLNNRLVSFGLKIEIKDNKYRFSTSNYYEVLGYGVSSDMAVQVRREIDKLQKSLYNFLISKPKDF